MKNSILCILAFATTLGPRLAFPQGSDVRTLVPALKQGGYVIVFRHGATSSDQTDVYPLNYSDMTKQRQLNEQGRTTARQIGAAFKSLGIPIGNIYSSRLNRAVETATLIGGKDVTPKEDLNDSSMGSTSAMAGASGGGSARHGQALREIAAALPRPGTNTIIVTHKTNIVDAFGNDWAEVKEASVDIQARPISKSRPPWSRPE